MKTEKPVEIIIGDDLTPFSNGLHEVLLKANRKFNLRFAKSGMQMLDMLGRKPAALAFISLKMPEMDGADVAHIISTRFPKTKIIVCLYFTDIARVRELRGASVCAYMLKGTRRDKIEPVIDIVMKGGEYYSPKVKEAVKKILTEEERRQKPDSDGISFTDREKEIMQKVHENFSNDEIGAQLFISERTVETHLGHIYGKLEIHSRSELKQYMTDRLSLSQ